MKRSTHPGLLLFAHGARDPNWALPFEAVAQHVREGRPGLPVELAFLEFMSPNLAEAGHRLVALGCNDVAVIPLFLGAGGHVRKDLPVLMADLAHTHPRVTWRLQHAIGEVDSVIRAMADAAMVLADHSPPSDTK
jgi:sirohydrochlorin cobaltochelatase